MIILIHHLRADECTSLHTMVEYLEYIVKHTCGIQVGFLLEKVCMLLKIPEITSQSFRHCKYIVNI